MAPKPNKEKWVRDSDIASKVNYNIINKQTGQVVGTAKTLSGARGSVDRRDNAYGSYIHKFEKQK